MLPDWFKIPNRNFGKFFDTCSTDTEIEDPVCSHFGSNHFLFERARVFPIHELLMANVDVGSDVPISLLGTSSNYGSPNDFGPDLDGMRHRSIDAQFNELRGLLLPLARGFADCDNQSQDPQ